MTRSRQVFTCAMILAGIGLVGCKSGTSQTQTVQNHQGGSPTVPTKPAANGYPRIHLAQSATPVEPGLGCPRSGLRISLGNGSGGTKRTVGWPGLVGVPRFQRGDVRRSLGSEGPLSGPGHLACADFSFNFGLGSRPRPSRKEPWIEGGVLPKNTSSLKEFMGIAL